MSSRRPSRSRLTALGALALLLGGLGPAGCATVPPAREPLNPEVQAARALIERRWRDFGDLRSLAEIRIRRGEKIERWAGVLLLRAPSSLRFEALSPFGTPVLLVAADAKTLTLWEVLAERAFLFPASPEANRRWLGLALGGEELVALLAGRVLPLADPLAAELPPPDLLGPSLRLRGPEGEQRIWFDPATGQPRQVEWTGGKSPARVVFADGAPGAPPAGLTLATLDGALDVVVRYREPRMNTGFDPDLLGLTVPERVKIQDFR